MWYEFGLSATEAILKGTTFGTADKASYRERLTFGSATALLVANHLGIATGGTGVTVCLSTTLGGEPTHWLVIHGADLGSRVFTGMA